MLHCGIRTRVFDSSDGRDDHCYADSKKKDENIFVQNGVARWQIFKPKNPDLGKFSKGLAVNDVDILYGH
jgi:hypothetical protein